MKLAKLSLAALLAISALSNLTSAPLEEAIKDIDVSGYGRYRFDAGRLKYASGRKNQNNFHRFTLDVNFKATLDDNFFSLIGLRYDARDRTGSHTRNGSGLTNRGLVTAPDRINATSFTIRQYYVGFTGISDTTILFGRQPARTFFTDDVVATGLKVLNTSISGVTLTGLFFTNFEYDEDIFRTRFSRKPGDNTMIHQKNLWGAAANGSFDWFSFKAWYAGLHKVTNFYAFELAANYPVSSDVKIRAKAQVAGSALSKTFKKNREYIREKTDGTTSYETDVKSSVFVGAELGLSAYGVDADAGFMTYGKKDHTSVHTIEYKGAYIKAGEKLIRYTNIRGKHTTWFAKLLYTRDAYSAGLDYVYDKEKNDKYFDDIKSSEWVIRLGYKYNNKLSFNTWYSLMNKKHSIENVDGYKDKINNFRFEARYIF